MGEVNWAAIAAQVTPGAAGIWTLVIMIGAFLIREWRESRKLSSSDRQARREGYAKQVSGLQVENRELRREITKTRREYADELRIVRAEFADYRLLCEHETHQLRAQLGEALNLMAGIDRQKWGQQIALIRQGEDYPQHIREAAERVASYIEKARIDGEEGGEAEPLPPA